MRKAVNLPRLGMLLVLFLSSVPQIAHSDLDFAVSDDPLLSDPLNYSFDEPRTISKKARWTLSLGGGYSMISPYYVDLPDFTTFLFTYFGYTLPPGLAVTFRRKLQPASMFEGSLMRRVSPWASIGVLGGMSTAFSAEIGEEEALGVPNGTLPFELDIHANLVVAKTLPVLQVGPWVRIGRRSVRPFLMAGAGWYEVNQATRLSIAGFGIQASSRSDEYIGGLMSGGATLAIGDNGSISVDCRYERIFSPGQKLEFVTPFLNFSYSF